MLSQRSLLSRHHVQLEQQVLPELENQVDLENWRQNIQKQLQKFQDMFYDGMDTLSKIKLGWFSNSTDKSNLQLAKSLARRGYNFCHDMKNKIHDALRNFRIQQYKLIKQALNSKKPIQKTMGKVFFIIAAILQIPSILACIVFSVPSLFVFPLVTIGVSVIAFIGTLVYEGIKVQNHRKIIQAFLSIQQQIIRLESLRV